MAPVVWTAIVLTCSNKDWALALQNELEARHSKGLIDIGVILLTVEDPKSNVGSGGATINALLTVVENLSARKGFTVINPDVLKDANILILHHGNPYTYDACGRAFTSLPAKFSPPDADGVVCNIDIILRIITKQIAPGKPPGVWVSSLDMLIKIPSSVEVKWQPCDACLVTMPTGIDYARHHGVCAIDTQGIVNNIMYQETEEVLRLYQRQDGCVPVIAGIVYLSTAVAERLLSFHMKPPLDACTYFGMDSGQHPLKLSLFFDVLLPMTTAVSEIDFVKGTRSSSFGKQSAAVESGKDGMSAARKLLWRELHGYKLKAMMVEGGILQYLSNSAAEHKAILLHCPVAAEGDGLMWSSHVQASIMDKSVLDEGVTVVNSVLGGMISVGSGTAITNSSIYGNFCIGSNSLISGISLDCFVSDKPIAFRGDLVMQGFHVCLKTMAKSLYVLTVHGIMDKVQESLLNEGMTFCNEIWSRFFNRTGILHEDLWPKHVRKHDQTLMSAKLFPVFHATDNIGLADILWLQGQTSNLDSSVLFERWQTSWRLSLEEIIGFTDISMELKSRKNIFYKVAERDLSRVLTNNLSCGFNNLYISAYVDGFSSQLFHINNTRYLLLCVFFLHGLGFMIHDMHHVGSESSDPAMVARVLANIADVLGSMSGCVGGLRSGPAANQIWKKAFDYLEKKDFRQGVATLAKERSHWLDRPDHLIRAARHYEGAAQIMIRHAVMTAKMFLKFAKGEMPPLGKWIQADCPARIDLSGGWSDTPPITYEHGGAVAVVGILINGQRPIGCKVRRIKQPVISLELIDIGQRVSMLTISRLFEMEDYSQPHVPGALIKAAFVCCDLVDLSSSHSLEEQLHEKYAGGFYIKSWSNLPHGSGMGSSSILAGAVLAALLTAAGKVYTLDELVHSVLYLEQLLTTGGGWQDQIGGLKGSFHLGLSEGKLPLCVEAIDLQVSQHIIVDFNSRLVLIYTGKTRLARNILQDVVRNWYARNPRILRTEDELVKLAHDCATALIHGKLDEVGLCVGKNWEMKKRVAPGCESEIIKVIMNLLRPFMFGMCSAGAGGGGFIYGILRDASMRSEALSLLIGQTGLGEIVVFDATVASAGLVITVQT